MEEGNFFVLEESHYYSLLDMGRAKNLYNVEKRELEELSIKKNCELFQDNLILSENNIELSNGKIINECNYSFEEMKKKSMTIKSFAKKIDIIYNNLKNKDKEKEIEL